MYNIDFAQLNPNEINFLLHKYLLKKLALKHC